VERGRATPQHYRLPCNRAAIETLSLLLRRHPIDDPLFSLRPSTSVVTL